MTVAAPDRATSLLEVNDLTVEFHSDDGWTRAVDGLSFSIRRGEVLAIVGESGAGKSATALAIVGLLPRPHGRTTAGSALLDGDELIGMTERHSRSVRGARVGMVFQDPLTALNPVQRIGTQLVEAVRAHERMDRRRALARSIELLGSVGLPNPDKVVSSYPHELSGGMRQRVVIAIAISGRPDLLIADEPTTALDVTVQAQVLDLLLDVRERIDTTILLITHDLGVVARMADRVLVMFAGRLVELGDVVDVFEDPCHPYTRDLLASTPRIGSISQLEPPSRSSGAEPPAGAAGCTYRHRCPLAIERCAADTPLPQLVEGHRSLVRCHRAAEVAPPEERS